MPWLDLDPAYGTSLDGQNDDLIGFCHSRRLPEPIIYTEVESASAEKEEKRFEIARLLRDARPGDVLLVPKADRFSRDILFTLKTFRDLVRRGVALWSVCEGFFPPDNQGETLLLMWAMQAQNELVRIRERTLGRRKALRSAGLFVEGTPPWGYTRSTGPGGTRSASSSLTRRSHRSSVRCSICASAGFGARHLAIPPRPLQRSAVRASVGYRWIEEPCLYRLDGAHAGTPEFE